MLRPLLQLKTSLNIMKTHTFYEKRTLFINNYLVFSKNYIMPPYKKLQTLISAFIKNLIFGKNRDPCPAHEEIEENSVVRFVVGVKVGSARVANGVRFPSELRRQVLEDLQRLPEAEVCKK